LVVEPIGTPVVILLYLLHAVLEELAWRGYMQDRVQTILELATAAVVMGCAMR
jgi:membrane protease YdiL (CAAX protease family)